MDPALSYREEQQQSRVKRWQMLELLQPRFRAHLYSGQVAMGEPKLLVTNNCNIWGPRPPFGMGLLNAEPLGHPYCYAIPGAYLQTSIKNTAA